MYFSARGEGGHCELQPGLCGSDSQPPTQLHVCGAVTSIHMHRDTKYHSRGVNVQSVLLLS